MIECRVVLASGSPRRHELLNLVGIQHEVRPPNIDETMRTREAPRRHAERLAREKATAVATRDPSLITIGADTIVVVNRKVLGKPKDIAEAAAMLKQLSGREHTVVTAVAVSRGKKIRSAVADLAAISGQKPIETKSRKSIASFKLRDGMTIGAKVTLRRERMYEFVDRLTTIALPRMKDFRGLNAKSFDGRGNFAMGLKEHTVFPEISYDSIETVWGMDIIVCTTARTNDEAKALLTELGFPFRTT